MLQPAIKIEHMQKEKHRSSGLEVLYIEEKLNT